jgi:hypothetical protein
MVWGIAAMEGLAKGWTLPEFARIDVEGLYIFFTTGVGLLSFQK